MNSIAAWAAPAATMVAAMMTAANLGARVTGWGFVVFTIGSIGWCVIALTSDQANLLWTNGFLTLVNGVGIWRWLGRKARYEAGSKSAEASSAASPSPTLMALGSIAGAKLLGPDGETLGTLVDGMMRCGDTSLAYVVMTDGGVAGVGEQLYVLSADEITFAEDHVSSRLPIEAIRRRGPVEPGQWPSRA
jgi:hypothetical protein